MGNHYQKVARNEKSMGNHYQKVARNEKSMGNHHQKVEMRNPWVITTRRQR